MRFPSILERGVLIRRYKRFLADVRLDSGGTVTAVCPNTGAMTGVCEPGSVAWLSRSANASRKYAHTWELVGPEGGAVVGVNTTFANAILNESLERSHAPELAGYANLRREVKYGDGSRIDFLLEDPARGTAHVEVKNAHMVRTAGLAEFPDCVTARGRKHLNELAALAATGRRAVMAFVVQRGDVAAFALARDVDPAYVEAFHKARAAGMEAYAYRCRVSPEEITLDRAIPIIEASP